MSLNLGGPYYCKSCDYFTADPLNWRKHLNTLRHDPSRPIMRVGRPAVGSGNVVNTTMSGNFEMLPNLDPARNHRLYIVGASGSGKSYFCADYIRRYFGRYPNNRFYLLTNKTDDPVLDDLNPTIISAEQAATFSNINELANSVVLFDDVDSLDKEQRKVVMQLYSHLLKDGRSLHIDVILTSHAPSNYHETRDALINSSHLVFFPKFNHGYHLNQFLKLYGDLSQAQIREIQAWNTRWCVIHREVPRFILSEHNLKLL